MRTVLSSEITIAVAKLCEEACIYFTEDVKAAINNCRINEQSPFGQAAMDVVIKNIAIAEEEHMPLCQDTGMAVVFVDLGQNVHIEGDLLEDAINAGVRLGYKSFRKSVTSPISRINTKDNTPAIIHTNIVKGDKITITVAPKGFGSENMSALRMLKPSEGIEGVKAFIVDAVSRAGSNPCPPVVVGVGIGGTMEKAAYLSKRSLIRQIGTHNIDADIAALEEELLTKINSLGIGPQGFGGTQTALAVHIDTYPTHIAGLPVAVNMQCHCARHAEAII